MTQNHTQSSSISYAYNAPEVNRKCQRLRQELGPNELYFNNNNDNNNNNNNSNNDGGSVRTSKNHGDRWQSIAGYILSPWIGRQQYLPISYSEASWTGLLNACDCVDEESALQLLPTECRETIPRNTYTKFSNISMSMRVLMSTAKMMEYHP